MSQLASDYITDVWKFRAQVAEARVEELAKENETLKDALAAVIAAVQQIATGEEGTSP